MKDLRDAIHFLAREVRLAELRHNIGRARHLRVEITALFQARHPKKEIHPLDLIRGNEGNVMFNVL